MATRFLQAASICCFAATAIAANVADYAHAAVVGMLVDPNARASSNNQFAKSIALLPNGNIVVTAPGDYTKGTNAGAVYLFSGTTHALISAAYGSYAEDEIGSGGVMALPSGNYVIISPGWHYGQGAVTFGNATTGVPAAGISNSNSITGSKENDNVGLGGVHVLSNGNLVILSPNWSGTAGAATWVSGKGGHGVVSGANSLVGSGAADKVGSNGLAVLTNGNYVVSSPHWNNGAGTFSFPLGAATWGSGVRGVHGTISATNSLVGTNSDYIGSGGVVPLQNGNYVVCSPDALADAGAATWGKGTTGAFGTVSSTNSLIGDAASDILFVCEHGVTPLKNGNYVVVSGNGGGGEVTWGNGKSGSTGVVSTSNSLVGSAAGFAGDQIGSGGITPLTNGNYVISSPYWGNELGAATWGSGSRAITGTISASNSLIGTSPAGSGPPTGDEVSGVGGVAALTNGNYVVSSPYWAANVGAVTWGNGARGTVGKVSAKNSLVGTTGGSEGDFVGVNGVKALTNGNYVVISPNWNDRRGAATWASGATRTAAQVSQTNSIVGSAVGDCVGDAVLSESGGLYAVCNQQGLTGNTNSFVAGSGVAALTNGNYVVGSPTWNSSLGAATWGSGTKGSAGAISATNSLIGFKTSPNALQPAVPIATPDGNYIVLGVDADALPRGAINVGNGTSGTVGVANSTDTATAVLAFGGEDASGNLYFTSLGYGSNPVLIWH